MADIQVPQKDGEIRVQINGDLTVLPVTKGRVSAEGVVLDAVLATVDNSRVVQNEAAKTA